MECEVSFLTEFRYRRYLFGALESNKVNLTNSSKMQSIHLTWSLFCVKPVRVHLKRYGPGNMHIPNVPLKPGVAS